MLLLRRLPIRLAAALTVGSCLCTVLVMSGPAVVTAAPSTTEPGQFVPVEPCRLIDTRDVDRLDAGASIDVTVAGACGVPADAVAAAVTVTAVQPDAVGFVTAWPGDEAQPETSVVNYRPGQVVANSQLVRVGPDGTVRAFSSAATDLLVDVTGYFVPVDGAVRSGRYVPVAPDRLVDTRDGGRPSAGGAVTITPDVPAGAIAVAVNIATSDSSAPGFFTAHATGTELPTASVLNTDRAGQTRAAAAIVPLSDGAFDVFTQRGDHVIVDIAGYFTGADADLSTDGLFVGATPSRVHDVGPQLPRR